MGQKNLTQLLEIAIESACSVVIERLDEHVDSFLFPLLARKSV